MAHEVARFEIGPGLDGPMVVEELGPEDGRDESLQNALRLLIKPDDGFHAISSGHEARELASRFDSVPVRRFLSRTALDADGYYDLFASVAICRGLGQRVRRQEAAITITEASSANPPAGGGLDMKCLVTLFEALQTLPWETGNWPIYVSKPGVGARLGFPYEINEFAHNGKPEYRLIPASDRIDLTISSMGASLANEYPQSYSLNHMWRADRRRTQAG